MDIEDRVRGYVCNVVSDCQPRDITSVTRFTAGDRHDVYRLSYRVGAATSKDVVVRVSTTDDSGELAQSRIEAAVLEALHGVGAPQLYDFRTASAWFDTPAMCLQFIDGEHRELASASPVDVERLGAVVASVHNLPIGELARALSGATTLQEYVEERLELNERYRPRLRRPLPGSLDGRVENAFSKVASRAGWARHAESFRSDEPLVLLHGDVAPRNVLWAEDPVLIDWEYARLGDPADEVAYIFGQNGFDHSRRDAFWAGYRRATTHPQLRLLLERATWWEPVLLLGSVLWWLERWSRRAAADASGEPDPTVPRAPEYYLEQATLRLAHFDHAVNASPSI